jgi:hypothetical protein
MSHLYDLPDHLARLTASKEFSDALKEANRSVEEFRADVEAALKHASKEALKEELRAYEHRLGSQALHNALERFKGDLASELKAVTAKHRADELAIHETALAVKALAKAAGKRA